MNIQSLQQEIIIGLNQSDNATVLQKCEIALKYIESISPEESETSEIKTLIWLAYIAQSQAHWQRGDFGLAEKPALIALEIAQKNNNTIENARSLANLGIIYKEQASYDKAYDYYQQSLRLAKELQNKDLEAKILGNIANILTRKGDTAKAIEYYELSNVIFDELNNKKGVALNIFNAAEIYKQAGDFTTSLEKLQEVLAISEKENDIFLIAHAHFHLAGINRSLERYGYALEHVKKAQMFNEKLQDRSLKYILLDTEGAVYVDMKKYIEAIECYNAALGLYTVDIKKDHIAHVYIHLGKLYSILDDFNTSELYLKKAISIFVEIGEKNSTYQAKIALADLYATQVNHPEIFQQAKKLVLEVLAENQESNSYNLLYHIYELLHNICAELHEFDEAYRYAKLLIHTDRKIRSVQAEKTLQQSTVRYLERERELLVEKNEQIFRQQQELEKQAKEITLQYEELQNANKRLEELGRFKEFVMATIVHDLKNPLNTILHIASLQEYNEDMASMYRAGKEMLLLVHNILEVQKFHDTSINVEIEECEINELIKYAVNQVQEFANERQITILSEFSVKVCYCSMQYIERTLVNLLTNAVKYSSPLGKVLIRCNSVDNEIVFSVQDWGKGIAPEDVDSIFEVYKQANKGKNVGVTFSTGIGLSFAKMAVEAHKGRIWAESELGKGSIFYFSLPFAGDNSHNEISKVFTSASFPTSLLQLSAEDRAVIASINNCWIEKKIPYYCYSDILDLLDSFEYTTEALQEWRKMFENLLFTANEEKILSFFKQYLV